MNRHPKTVASWAVIVGLGFLFASEFLHGQGPLDIKSDEPFARKFSWARGAAMADDAAAAWAARYRCVTCHTNGLHLVVGALTAKDSAAHRDSRRFARKYLEPFVVEKKKRVSRKGAIEGIVSTASFLAISDMETHGRLDPVTRRALDHIWKEQAPDGAWKDWVQCKWPPYETDEHFGVTLAAVAMGYAPPEYRQSPLAQAGLKKLLGYLRTHPPSNPHHKAMMMWASVKLPGVVDEATGKRWRSELLSLQRKDGGWRIVDLGKGEWKRPRETADAQPSDAFATAFVIFILRGAGVPAKNSRLVKGLNWLRRNQRESGRWFVRSPKKDGHHYISDAATNFAVMAFAACGVR